MVTVLPVSARLVRAALLLVAGWLVLEYALMSLIAARIGWGATLVFLSVKGGLGLLLVGVLAARGLARLKQRARGRGFDLAFAVLSGVLITLPGLVPSLVGLALFSPSLRAGLLRRFRPQGESAAAAPREIDLDAGEFRELRRRRIAKRTPRPRKNGEGDALEAKPPSV